MTTTENTAPSFDLRRQAWVPVIRHDGSRAELGLQEALSLAHEWRAISDPLPTVEFGLYRLLVAFVLDIFAPQNGEDWADLWAGTKFDEGRIAAYFDQHEGAFDLFGDRPFLQSAGMIQDNASPIAAMTHSIPSGSANNHFHHGSGAELQLAPSVAARWLSAVSPFAIQGGRGYFTGINGSPPWYVMPLGEHGFETLLLNTPVIGDFFLCSGEEIPSWRSTLPVANEKLMQSSLLQSLTWRPRRVRLIGDAQGGECSVTGHNSKIIVKEIFYAAGEGAGFDWTDPNVGYSIGEKRLPTKPRAGREIWRDTGPLGFLKQTPSNNKKDIVFQRPAIISQVSELASNNYFDRRGELKMALYGLRCKEANVFEWQCESLSVPLPLLWEDLEASEAQSAMNEAEKVAYAIKRAIKITYPREAQGNDKAFETLANSATTLFWRDLRAHYDDHLRFLAAKPDEETRLSGRQKWRHTLRDQGWRALKFAIDDLDGDAKALKRQTDAYASFSRALFALLEPEKARTSKERRKTKELAA